ncbi:MAG: hypothetical protein U1E65_33780 [Myxococcota bacterium]
MSRILELWTKRTPPAPAPPDPIAAFDAIISARRQRYQTLRRLTLELIFRRLRLAEEQEQRRFDIARLHADQRQAALRGAADEARFFEEQRRRRASDLAATGEALDEAAVETLAAKRKLAALGAEIQALELERKTAQTRLLHRRFRDLESRPEAANLEEALERAREVVERHRAEAVLEREAG